MAGPYSTKSANRSSTNSSTNRSTHGRNTGEALGLGLVPHKYLKRRAKEDTSSSTNSTGAGAGAGSGAGRKDATPSTGGTPPRKAKPQIHNRNRNEQGGSLKDIMVTDYVDCVPSLTPQERLKRQHELNRALTKRRIPGLMTTKTDPISYLEEWKIATLRAEGYQVSRAVTRILHHWKVKSELFGTPDLKVTLRDVAPNLMQSGMIQLVPTRDLTGRAVVCVHFRPRVYASQEREFRKYLFYMLASALEDENTQDKGIVLLVWNNQAQQPTPWGGLFDSFWNLWKSMRGAVRMTRLHYIQVHDDHGAAAYSVKEYEEVGTLIRHHKGSAQECLHALLTFGLPVPMLPIGIAGMPPTGGDVVVIPTDYHWKWVDWRQRTDSYHHQHHWKIVLVPNRQDVLFGKHVVVNGGNIRFHQMVAANVEEYQASTESEQAAMRTQIYKNLVNSAVPLAAVNGAEGGGGGGGRCLQPLDPKEGILWEPMEEATADAKISKAFDYVAKQLQEAHSALDGTPVPATDLWDFGGFVFSKECCYIATCRDGYHVCGGDASKLSTYWQN